MTETLRLTNSEMRTWRRCKRKWYFSYYRGLHRAGRTFNEPLSIGSRLHDTLEVYYRPGLQREDPMEHFRKQVEADIEANPTQEDRVRKEADLVEAMLTGYFEWLEEEGHDAELRVLAPEAELEHPLIEGVTVLSKIDALVESVVDGSVGSIEHKTCGNFKDPQATLQVDTQLLTEHLVKFLAALEEGEDPNENAARFILYNMLRKVKRTASAKPPFFQREVVHHSVNELRSHWKHIVRIATEIQAARVELDAGADHHDVCYPNPQVRQCSWDCEFKKVCLSGMTDDGTDIEPFLADEFEIGDPLERYRHEVGLDRLPSAESEQAEVGSES